ncbi:D-isomer specific 2-hydroxyacid dehydrogenase [Microdochium trichocladiopsis]|uniref:D-isomer specific 2-hydroxyacid dehydrogenase n=1 Tax=Microdochium trichocladiopsis TaxID=1682393 RepID=A0A9P8Y128_9PEZI|nr:D-isomer specific 2-hydroxyacid dehydrogenase [Microdochium trichocladiopsis]KAH7026555.1 D-isomer specific 2-hydroxyacid dehydrogenase [Microdochium trichocladiopsis]
MSQPPPSSTSASSSSAPPKPTVLLVGDMRQAGDHWSSLASKYNLLSYHTPGANTRAEFLRRLREDPSWQAIVGCYRSNHSTSVTGPFDAELVALLPKGWRFIAHLGAGYDNIDVRACTARGIAVSNTPGAVDDATADAGIFLMLGALRRAGPAIAAIKAGTWRGGGGAGGGAVAVKGHGPKGKVLGILGMGGIGRAMACRAVGFGMDVVYHNRNRVSDGLEYLGATTDGHSGQTKEHRARYVSFDELLASADVLSLNLALNESTRGIISAAELARLKKGAVVVNTARGALIDESALVDALESGRVSAVGLDVFEKEPVVHPGLLASDRAFLLPHVGTMTWETELEMEMLTIRNLEAAVDTGKLLTLVGEQKGLGWAEGEGEGEGKA